MRIRTHWSSTLILLPLLAGSLALLLWSQPKAAGQGAATLRLDRMPVRIESGPDPAAPHYGRKKTGEEYIRGEISIPGLLDFTVMQTMEEGP